VVTDRQNDTLGDDAVVMYIPIGVSVSDSLQYSTFEEGLLGGAIARFTEGNEGALPDTIDALMSTGRDLYEGGLRRSASLLGENVRAIVDRNAGRVVNPREFMLFKAPSLRSFSFSFRFVPESVTEARVIPEIIRYFRSASYPGIATRLDYTVPQAFSINFRNTSSMIRIPQVVCTSINTSYNPTSLSYLREDKMPSEITMELGFQELTALTRENIEDGF